MEGCGRFWPRIIQHGERLAQMWALDAGRGAFHRIEDRHRARCSGSADSVRPVARATLGVAQHFGVQGVVLCIIHGSREERVRTLLIVNPIAGRGNAERVLPQIREYLTEEGLDFDVVLTQAPGHAVELAERAVADGYDLLVVVAGDGTSNEVLNGMMHTRNGDPVGTLGVIPVGSGNDFSVGIGMVQDLREACRRVVHGTRRLIDVGQVGDRYFGNGAGVGFDAIVGLVAAKNRVLRGLPLYLLAVLQTILFYFRAPVITVECDGREHTAPLIMISVTNGRRMGGGFWVTPEAEVDDGLFDLMLAREMSRLRMLSFVPMFIKGTHIREQEVTMDRASRVVLTTDGDLVAHADGEVVCTDAHRLEFRLHPKALWVVT